MILRAALYQSTTGVDPALSAQQLVARIEEAAVQGAHCLFTPEMSGVLDRDRQRARQSIVAEGADPVLAAVREAAARTGLWVHLGSLAVRTEEGKFANRSFVIDGAGQVRARYDKIHLFDVDLPTGESWRESASYAGGDEAVAVETPWGIWGLAICYDVRFPALFQALSGAGARLLLVPAAFTVPTGKAHWHPLLRARAIENGCWLIAVGQTGAHADGRKTYGHSLVINPWGEIVLDMEEVAGLALVDLDMEQVDEVRQRIPVISHRQAIGKATLA